MNLNAIYVVFLLFLLKSLVFISLKKIRTLMMTQDILKLTQDSFLTRKWQDCYLKQGCLKSSKLIDFIFV